ncbi:MAG: hypothetical protein U9R00_02750 [Patescibacteria group bacterium]|nr:hypothetical protein [Patescibacteria group bacterium]
MPAILQKVQLAIENIGYIYFAILIVIDIILWKIHPVLGILGVTFTIALIFGLI